LSGPYARELAKEDENMPTMQGLPEEVAYLRCGVKEGLRFLSQRYCGLPTEILYLRTKMQKQHYRKKAPTQRKTSHLNQILRSAPTTLRWEDGLGVDDYRRK